MGVRGCRRRLLTVACVLRPGPWRIGTMPDPPEGNEYSSLHTDTTRHAQVYERSIGRLHWFGEKSYCRVEGNGNMRRPGWRQKTRSTREGTAARYNAADPYKT